MNKTYRPQASLVPGSLKFVKQIGNRQSLIGRGFSQIYANQFTLPSRAIVRLRFEPARCIEIPRG